MVSTDIKEIKAVNLIMVLAWVWIEKGNSASGTTLRLVSLKIG